MWIASRKSFTVTAKMNYRRKKMSWQTYDDSCRGCKPAMLNFDTGQPLPDSAPQMQVVLALFAELSPAEKQAWHRFTCLNSRVPQDLAVVEKFMRSIEQALMGSPS
jgi:hypothetical protein